MNAPTASADRTASNIASRPERLTSASSILGEPLERMAVRNPASRRAREDGGNLRERLEAEIEVHQALPQGRRLKAEALEGEIERIAGDLPEVGVAVLERAQPGVLDLLVAPERGQRGALFLRNVGAARRGGGEVEQGAVGVEDAGADVLQGSGRLGHRSPQDMGRNGGFAGDCQRGSSAWASCPSSIATRLRSVSLSTWA